MYELLKNKSFKEENVWVTTQNRDIKTEKTSQD